MKRFFVLPLIFVLLNQALPAYAQTITIINRSNNCALVTAEYQSTGGFNKQQGTSEKIRPMLKGVTKQLHVDGTVTFTNDVPTMLYVQVQKTSRCNSGAFGSPIQHRPSANERLKLVQMGRIQLVPD